MKRVGVVVIGLLIAALAPAGRAQAGDYGRTLHSGSPAEAGLLPKYADQIPRDAAAGEEPGTGADGHPLYPGAVVLAARHGVIAEYAASGYNLRYADQQGDELPRDQWIPTTKNTIYDLASLSKIFTTIAAMQQVEHGRLALDRTVASYIPAFAANGKGSITIEQLLTHTSGLPADPSPALWTYQTYQERVDAIYASPLKNAPGSAYLYSDLNFMTLGKLVEKVTGRSLDKVVHDDITAPLHMTDTMYNPPARLKYRIAAEEYQLTPDRGLTWGVVHDENAWALGGVSGHAGVFSTAHDLAILCQTILNGGIYGHTRILSAKTVAEMSKNYNQKFPDDSHGLGFELAQYWYVGALGTPYTLGHTGFTGTSIAIDPTTDSFVILLTNHVHPNRNWGSVNPRRVAVADDVGRAIPVHPLPGHGCSWYTGMRDNDNASLSLPVNSSNEARLDFRLWYSTEAHYDVIHLESTSDGGQTWAPVPFQLDGKTTDGTVSGYGDRRWHDGTATLPAGAGQVRWRYTTDVAGHGRGGYVSGVRITAGHHVLFDDRAPGSQAEFQANGWECSPT